MPGLEAKDSSTSLFVLMSGMARGCLAQLFVPMIVTLRYQREPHSTIPYRVTYRILNPQAL